MIERSQPIIAIATAPGIGAVGIVRISGVKLEPFIQTLLGKNLLPRVATLCELNDAAGATIDQLVALYFMSPNSYTGEDVLELQGHGGPILLNMILERCLELSNNQQPMQKTLLKGLRLARPGEFTERAFLNAKLDLTQAEAVMDLISAGTKLAAQSAIRSLQGEFSKDINKLKKKLIYLRILVEASIDFPEEEIDFIKSEQARELITEIKENIELILFKTRQGKVLSQGVRVVIAGQPNSGKSSLMNALSGEETSIVSSIEGTTRDVLSETVSISGVPFYISDTAGLRKNSEDEVEKIGIQRAWRRIKEADILIFLSDLSRNEDKSYLEKNDWILETIKEGEIVKPPVLYVYNKTDLLKEGSLLKKVSENEIFISAKTGEGLQNLKEMLLEISGWKKNGVEDIYLARQRHIQALNNTEENIKKAEQWISNSAPSLELIAEELRLAQNSLSEVTGEFSSEDLLGEIFSNFCIGK